LNITTLKFGKSCRPAELGHQIASWDPRGSKTTPELPVRGNSPMGERAGREPCAKNMGRNLVGAVALLI
jgi:hypothetical protein